MVVHTSTGAPQRYGGGILSIPPPQLRGRARGLVIDLLGKAIILGNAIGLLPGLRQNGDRPMLRAGSPPPPPLGLWLGLGQWAYGWGWDQCLRHGLGVDDRLRDLWNLNTNARLRLCLRLRL